ncbi:MAG: hypothetical protein GXO27_02345 [Chlorobi bacterium]|nr:hypothetical protein [Chlorobiota bacterium]
MVTLEIRNLNEVEDVYLGEIRRIIKHKKEYYENLFKKYSKNIVIEIEFNKERLYRVNISTNLISKTVSVTELDRDPVEALRRAFAEFKKAVKRQIALERKDYLYKRKRYRQQKWREYFDILEEDVEESVREDKPRYSRKVKNAMKSVQKYLKKRLKELGFTKKQIKAQMPGILELIEKRFYRIFDPKVHTPENLDALLFKITEEILEKYQNTLAEAEGAVDITEFEGDEEAPREEIYEPELYFIEDFSDDENLIDKVTEQYSLEQIDDKIEKMMSELSPKEQAAVHLHFLEQFDNDEIAEVTGMDSGEIRKTIEAFKQNVRESFEKDLK